MDRDWDVVMHRHYGALETATGRSAGQEQRRTAVALCNAFIDGQRVVTSAPAPEDALLVAALAAAALAEGVCSVHLATRRDDDGGRLIQAFREMGLAERVSVAPAEALAFEYLKGGGVGATGAPVAVVVDADQILVRDANTPLVLAASPSDTPPAVSPEAREEADRTLQSGRDYTMQEGRVVVRDPETGQDFPGRRFTRGLHAAVEAREGLTPTDNGAPVAQIRLGDYFRRYPSLAAVSGVLQEQCVTLYGMEAR